jgi:hypothetical protein
MKKSEKSERGNNIETLVLNEIKPKMLLQIVLAIIAQPGHGEVLANLGSLELTQAVSKIKDIKTKLDTLESTEYQEKVGEVLEKTCYNPDWQRVSLIEIELAIVAIEGFRSNYGTFDNDIWVGKGMNINILKQPRKNYFPEICRLHTNRIEICRTILRNIFLLQEESSLQNQSKRDQLEEFLLLMGGFKILEKEELGHIMLSLELRGKLRNAVMGENQEFGDLDSLLDTLSECLSNKDVAVVLESIFVSSAISDEHWTRIFTRPDSGVDETRKRKKTEKICANDLCERLFQRLFGNSIKTFHEYASTLDETTLHKLMYRLLVIGKFTPSFLYPQQGY